MLAFRSLDPFRALREPDRRRRDEERLSHSEQRTLSKTQNNHLTAKAPYKFESVFLQRRVGCELPESWSPPTVRLPRHGLQYLGRFIVERDPLPRVGLRVRIRLPPAKSPLRT